LDWHGFIAPLSHDPFFIVVIRFGWWTSFRSSPLVPNAYFVRIQPLIGKFGNVVLVIKLTPEAVHYDQVLPFRWFFLFTGVDRLEEVIIYKVKLGRDGS
jgi:hypothetical protein